MIQQINKIEVAVNERDFQKEYSRLQKDADTLNEGIALCTEITEGTITAFSIDAVNLWLTNKADFPNIVAIADLLGCKPLYEKLVVLDSKKKDLESQFITFDKGSYKITDKSLQALKSTFTTYLQDDKIDDYKSLLKVVKTMNSLDKQTRLALIRTADLEYNINLFRLNHSV